MNLHQIDFEETKRFFSIFLDYIQNREELRSYYRQRPEIESFENAIANRNFDNSRRPVLVKILKSQYEKFSINNAVSENIDSLREENTFTVTTGHQLNIFTGPLFFIYKITAAINMAKILNERYPAYHFVPVYWMASEDHDFEEINNFRLFGKKYFWDTAQKGPVGKFETKSMQNLIDEMIDIPTIFSDAYLTRKNLSEATRYIANELFGDHGLVILDADEREFKIEFRSIIKDDLFNHSAHKHVQKTTEQLIDLGYKSQIFPRPINFFYMEDGLRERIEEEDGSFRILNTSMIFSRDEMEKLIDEYPEKFSPNVVLRPVYQEVILPNLAYIGGPAEVSYWLQLKGVFDHFETPFPMLFPRLFAMIIPKAVNKKMNKLGLDGKSVFKSFEDLKEQLLYKNAAPVYDLSDQRDSIKNIFQIIKEKSSALDKSLEGFVMSEFKKTEKGVENIQKRLKKAEEQKEEVSIKQLEGILEKLFPNGNPQERVDNFLNFYINNPEFINELIELLNPFELKYNILTEDE